MDEYQEQFQQFLEKLPKMPLEERVQVVRFEALGAVNHAKGFTKVIQKETEDCAELPTYVDEYFELVLRKLDELQHLVNALVTQVDSN
ncbi:MAG: hypothetical protein R3D55_26545 [Chloroflexota bacterium]